MLCRLSWSLTPEERKERYQKETATTHFVAGTLTNLVWCLPWYLGWVGLAIFASQQIINTYLFVHAMLSLLCALFCSMLALSHSRGIEKQHIWTFHMVDSIAYMVRGVSFLFLFIATQGLFTR